MKMHKMIQKVIDSAQPIRDHLEKIGIEAARKASLSKRNKDKEVLFCCAMGRYMIEVATGGDWSRSNSIWPSCVRSVISAEDALGVGMVHPYPIRVVYKNGECISYKRDW